MISSVRGTVIAVAGTTAIIEVGGVGLAVSVTPQLVLSLRIGTEARLHTALIVREDDLALFGFQEADELAVFDLLRGVTGVGPKSAIGVLAAISPAEIATAVATENDGAFRKVSGIGPKTAKLIVLSLAGKMLPFAATAPSAPTSANPVSKNVLVALVGLGWSERVAAQAVDEAVAEASATEAASVPALLRVALTRLGPRQASAARSEGVPS
ncbi:Holliday junction branch migration protein RuvA [Marisediminicola antarctica]|uniref:Holliday junction branch migration complex subunit RuvA n=1 Tax=Marisediminicola antarctica TaxID=674079 RepID=A0A7L5AIT3_9MICO|nr:Holliday junction branch migration protein RuvA [Marisediminicola antarctica]QHO69972.1 Holliday junction DNA helicase RuvA [Marisediminicola antarctica]